MIFANGNTVVMILYRAFTLLYTQMHFTRNWSEQNDAWPEHQDLHALLFVNSLWVFSVPMFFFFAWTVKDCKKEPTVYSPYPRRLENLFNYKGSTFSPVIFRPWVKLTTSSEPSELHNDVWLVIVILNTVVCQFMVWFS